MSKPIVAIVGRPNVGKSTFFNSIIGERRAIVSDIAGCTRDRIYADATWQGHNFDLIDTGGIDAVSEQILDSEIRSQAMLAAEMANVIIFMVDGKDGLTNSDREVADLLRHYQTKTILVVNKIDTIGTNLNEIYDFYELGLGEPIAISSANMLGLGDLLDLVVQEFSEDLYYDENTINLAIIGKPNSGKSSLVNALTNQNRVIVSDIPGTTRDSIDTRITYNNQSFNLIDTAGLRRRSRVNDDIEKYSNIRTLAAIERSDISVLMIDATSSLTEQDKKILGVAHEAGKGIIIAVNKWDLIAKETNTMRDFEQNIKKEIPFASYAPVLFISAINKLRIFDVLEIAKQIHFNRSQRISTSRLNAIINDAILIKEPPSYKGKRLKIYYTAQIGSSPPKFALNINSNKLMHFSYARYLENKLREAVDFTGTSIKLLFNEKHNKDNEF